MTTPRHKCLPRTRNSVFSDELLTVSELCKRLKWGRRSRAKAIEEGLRVIRHGRIDYCIGEDVLAYFRRLAGEGDA